MGYIITYLSYLETVLKPKVTRENQVEVGIRTSNQASIGRGTVGRDVPESLMLTGDENIVDVDFSVQWVIMTPLTTYLISKIKVYSKSCRRKCNERGYWKLKS